MTFKSKLAVFTGIIILAGSALAKQQNVCPSIDAIKAVGVSMAEEIAPNRFIAYHSSRYDSDAKWGFIIAPLESQSDELAIDKANEILESMTAPGIPEQHSGALMCDYETGRKDIFAAAIKDDEMLTPAKLKLYLKKAH